MDKTEQKKNALDMIKVFREQIEKETDEKKKKQMTKYTNNIEKFILSVKE